MYLFDANLKELKIERIDLHLILSKRKIDFKKFRIQLCYKKQKVDNYEDFSDFGHPCETSTHIL